MVNMTLSSCNNRAEKRLGRHKKHKKTGADFLSAPAFVMI